MYSETDKHLPPGWHKHTDAEGVAYYTNDTTGETQWTPPKGSAEEALTRSRVVTRQEESPWSENYDSATSKSCECPPLCTCRRAHNSPCPNDPTRVARPPLPHLNSLLASADYFNKVTGVTTWVRPPDFV